jgi:uncharacterized membrane-anchored protein
MHHDFNAELHARPSMHFEGPALIEHAAFLPTSHRHLETRRIETGPALTADKQIIVEHHTEFVTVTRVTPLRATPETWPQIEGSEEELAQLAGESGSRLICKLSILVLDGTPKEIGASLGTFGFGDTAVSSIGDGAAHVCSDFLVGPDLASRILLFNERLNRHRLGRMVRRVCEIETYRSMALLALPEARRLAPVLVQYDSKLIDLTDRNAKTARTGHRLLLDEISSLSAEVIKATAETRNRFGATTAYAKIVEERIAELRETHVSGFQRFGVFVVRRFRPAVRSCQATAVRLEQLSRATMHLIDLLQTQIQVEIEYQNATQIQAVAERAATQVKIQRAVEGFSIIAISYYLLSLLKVASETLDHAGYHIDPLAMLVSIPIVIAAVSLAILRVKHALKAEH